MRSYVSRLCCHIAFAVTCIPFTVTCIQVLELTTWWTKSDDAQYRLGEGRPEGRRARQFHKRGVKLIIFTHVVGQSHNFTHLQK